MIREKINNLRMGLMILGCSNAANSQSVKMATQPLFSFALMK
jgi:hypothetical protein